MIKFKIMSNCVFDKFNTLNCPKNNININKIDLSFKFTLVKADQSTYWSSFLSNSRTSLWSLDGEMYFLREFAIPTILREIQLLWESRQRSFYNLDLRKERKRTRISSSFSIGENIRIWIDCLENNLDFAFIKYAI